MGTRLENADGMGSTQLVDIDQSIMIATEYLGHLELPGEYEIQNAAGVATAIFEHADPTAGKLTPGMKPHILMDEESRLIPIERDGVTYMATVTNLAESSS